MATAISSAPADAVADARREPQRVLAEECEQVADDQRAGDADVLEHLAQAKALLRGLGLGHVLAEEHHAVGQRREQVERELQLPAPVQLVVEHPAERAADHEARGPARVQDIEVVRAVLGEERRDQRVGHGLERAVRVGEDEHAPVQARVGARSAGGEGHHGREHVQRERGDDQLAVADLVAHDAADDDTEAEARETRTGKGAELPGREAILRAPVVENPAADGDTDAGGEDRHEAGPQQTFRVRNNRFVADLGVAHRGAQVLRTERRMRTSSSFAQASAKAGSLMCRSSSTSGTAACVSLKP